MCEDAKSIPEAELVNEGAGGKSGNGGTPIAAPDQDGYIEEIGDRIAGLTPQQASELKDYLETAYDLHLI